MTTRQHKYKERRTGDGFCCVCGSGHGALFHGIDGLAQALRARGFDAKVKRSDNIEQTDDAITITDKIEVQVGYDYMGVGLEEGEGDDLAWWHWDTRQRSDVEGLVADLQQALAGGRPS